MTTGWANETKSLGLNVSAGIAPSILELMQFYPQPVRMLPLIEFLPRNPSQDELDLRRP
jgi:Serine dehydrogenase proteinase